jgi:hypothetical protein
MIDFNDLDEPLSPGPQFYVEAPDGLKHWPEIDRQSTFFKLLRYAGPRVDAFANANAGKRNPRLAKKEGIRGGVFDVTCLWRPPVVAWIEFKGYDKRGRAGKLSDNQIRFGNRLVELGIPCACFFSPQAAIDWLHGQGFPISGVRDAA